jgi:hypothetical protein
MNEQIITKDNIKQFTDQCFDKENDKAARIVKGILDAKSPRISDISNEMEGNPDANYKTIQRFLDNNDPRENLHRLFNEDTQFIIGDPTEIHRLQAKKTKYVGKVGKGKKLGFWMLVLASPYKGRAIPFNFITYSSKTLNDELSSRNLEHLKVIAELKELLGDKVLVFDREFSYELFFENMVIEGIKFVIRLNVGNNPTITNENGDKISLTIKPGDEVNLRGVYYKGKVEVNISGKWDKGFSEPMWVISNLPPEEAIKIYRLRMKIEESFKDMKNLLSIEKIMNQKQENMEKMASMVLLSYSIGLLIGETIRENVYTEKKRKLYSGLHILLKRKVNISGETLKSIINSAYLIFSGIVLCNIQT